jgi:branched-chain amino acid transport system ATP-binding protein
MTILEGTGVSKNFGGLMAVSDADFHVNEGEIVGLIGPNGAGKTTLFNLISGTILPQSGSIRFKGEEITGKKPHEICQMGIARTFQSSRLFSELPGFYNVRLAAQFGKHGRLTDTQAEKEVNQLMAFCNVLGERWKPAKDLSVASQKRLEIARALATRPDLLLLDEVMSGLTPTELARSMELIQKIRDRGVTIFMVEHVMKAIMGMCDRIIVFHHGSKIEEGTPAQVASSPTVIEIYLGEPSDAGI